MELPCGTAKAVLVYMEDRFGVEEMQRFVADAKMNVAYLQSRSNWISFDFYCRLLRNLVAYTDDPHAPYDIGILGPSRRCYGAAAFLVARLATISAMYAMMVTMASHYNKISTWTMQKKRRGSCTVAVQYHGYAQDRNNCLSLQGIFAGIPVMHGLPATRVTHLQCACDGGDTCVYELAWTDRPRWMFAGIGTIAGLTTGGVLAMGLGGGAFGFGALVLLTFACCSLGRNFDYHREVGRILMTSDRQARFLEQSIQDNEVITKQLQDTVEERTEELRQAMKRLALSHKKELTLERHTATGLLASAMAHQMNSPLNAISLSLESLMEDLRQDPTFEPILSNAKRGSLRCRDILNQLLAFSRESQRTRQARLEDIVTSSVAAFREEQAGSTEVSTRIAPDLPAIHLDEAQIQQVILNLLTNASDAMEGGGKAEVSVEMAEDSVILGVLDEGPGIDEDKKTKIFEPLYSTKRNRPRLGIGLSIAARLVATNGGTISARNRADKGSILTACFPIRDGEETPPPSIPSFLNTELYQGEEST